MRGLFLEPPVPKDFGFNASHGCANVPRSPSTKTNKGPAYKLEAPLQDMHEQLKRGAHGAFLKDEVDNGKTGPTRNVLSKNEGLLEHYPEILILYIGRLTLQKMDMVHF